MIEHDRNHEEFELELKTPLRQMIAQYLFGDGSYNHAGGEAAQVLAQELKVNVMRYYDGDQKLTYYCAPETEPKMQRAFAEIVHMFKTPFEGTKPEWVKELCDFLNKPPTPSTPAVKPPTR